MFDNRVYETRAYKYCKRVATGKVPSNKWMILFANKFIITTEITNKATTIEGTLLIKVLNSKNSCLRFSFIFLYSPLK